MKSKILLIEDDDSFVNAVRLTFRGKPVEIVSAATGAEGIKLYRQHIHAFATVIIDYCLPDLKGSEVALTLRKINPEQDLLFATGVDKSEFLIDLLETGGARSFLFKGRPMEELRTKINDSITIYESKNRVIGQDGYAASKAELELLSEGFVGRSAAMYEMLQNIRVCREQLYSTLIVGETGTGKELVARALVTKGKNLIVVDCPRYSGNEHLLESDLFGHVKGAFTGADRDKPGLLSQADGQVVFLDELHMLSIDAQTKLLRFLQEMKYRRVGDHAGKEIPVSFRLISAAKPEIWDKLERGEFLEDLIHRVSRLEIQVPALRQRPDDVEPLVRHAQNQFNEGKLVSIQKQVRISTVNEMTKHPWSGNVRQLQNAVFRMLTNARTDIVSPADFESYLKKGKSIQIPAVGLSLTETTNIFESEEIKKALMLSRTKMEAASRLGLTRWSLTRTLNRLGISAEMFLLQT